MNLIVYAKTSFLNYILTKRERLPIAVFCKSLYAFLILKILFLWPVLAEGQRYFPHEFPSLLHKIIYAPVTLAQYNLTVFLTGILILLAVGLLVRINYVIGALVFWFSLSLTRLAYPFVNGSDYVLNLFLFLAIFLAVVPAFKKESLREAQYIVSNFSLLVCKIQLCLIYILSGFDKLTSAAWRSGDAVFSITNLDYFMNPHLSISASKGLYMVMAWMIILFELSFPVLIWFKRFRVYALAGGVIFHLVIIFGLSLPDFGLIMLLLYSLFIPFGKKRERDYASSLR